MSKTIESTTEQIASTQRPPATPLSKRLEKELPKEPGQIIRAKQVFGDNYRVNWYNPIVFGLDGPKGDGKIVKSQFLKVTVTDGGELLTEDKTIASRPFPLSSGSRCGSGSCRM